MSRQFLPRNRSRLLQMDWLALKLLQTLLFLLQVLHFEYDSLSIFLRLMLSKMWWKRLQLIRVKKDMYSSLQYFLSFRHQHFHWTKANNTKELMSQACKIHRRYSYCFWVYQRNLDQSRSNIDSRYSRESLEPDVRVWRGLVGRPHVWAA